MPTDTRLESLLTTNVAPLDQEIKEVMEMITEREAETDYLEKQVVQRMALLEDLVLERDKKCHSAQALRCILAPHRRLPTELLVHIFLLCHSSHEEVHAHPKRYPMLLGQVCSHWREIMLTTPFFWRRLSITLNWRKGDDHSFLLTEWLRRAAPLPLDLVLKEHGYASSNGVLGRVLAPSIASCVGKLVIRLLSESVEPLKGVLSDGLPLLETVVFGCPGSEQSWGHDSSIDFTKCQQLRTVQFERRFVHSPALVLPWAQLTNLCHKGYHISAAEALRLLALCTKLKECRLNIEGWQHGENTELSACVHLQLRHLDIRFSGSHIHPFLQHLTLPALVDLSIADVGSSDESMTISTALSDLQRRSAFKLKCFDVRLDRVNLVDLVPFFKAVPRLRKLKFRCGYPRCSELIHALTYNVTNDYHLLPKLGYLSVRTSLCPGDMYELLFPMIKSRWWFSTDDNTHPTDVACLKSVTIHTREEFRTKLEHHAYPLRREGLIFNLHGHIY